MLLFGLPSLDIEDAALKFSLIRVLINCRETIEDFFNLYIEVGSLFLMILRKLSPKFMAATGVNEYIQ